MKKLILGAAAITLMFSACKKSEDEKPSNTWNVGGTTYTAAQVVSTGSGLSAATTAGTGNAIVFQFSGNALPTASGSYNITQTLSSSSVNQVVIVASESSSSGAYTVKSGTVAVTVNGGKVSVNLPASAAAYTGATTKADAQISANLTQN